MEAGQRAGRLRRGLPEGHRDRTSAIPPQEIFEVARVTIEATGCCANSERARQARTYWRLGPANLARAALCRALLRAGHYRRRMPLGE